MLLRRFALSFRLQEPMSFSVLSVKNLRQEVLIAVAMENQSRPRRSLAIDIIDVEIRRFIVVLVADYQSVSGPAAGEPAHSIFTRFELFITNHEIEWNVRADSAAEACKPDDGHGNDKGQCGDKAKYLLFQNYLR
jgi:hypothetical protein